MDQMITPDTGSVKDNPTEPPQSDKAQFKYSEQGSIDTPPEYNQALPKLIDEVLRIVREARP